MSADVVDSVHDPEAIREIRRAARDGDLPARRPGRWACQYEAQVGFGQFDGREGQALTGRERYRFLEDSRASPVVAGVPRHATSGTRVRPRRGVPAEGAVLGVQLLDGLPVPVARGQ